MRCLIILLLFSYAAWGQNDSLACNFKFVADDSLIGKTYRFEVLRFRSKSGIKKRNCTKVESKIKLLKYQKLTITKEWFSSKFKDACIIDKFRLEIVEIEFSRPGYVFIYMNYEKPNNNQDALR